MKLDEYRAALVEYRHDGVYDCRFIEYGRNCNRLVKSVSESVNHFARMLIEAHWECLLDCDFGETRHKSLSAHNDQLPTDGSRLEDVIEQLTALSNELIADDQYGSADKIKHTEWYAFVAFINDCLPDKNYIIVPVEGNLIDFSKSMLQREVSFYRPLGELSLSTWEAQFLGELSVLAARETFDEGIGRNREREYLQLFHQLVQKFNNYNCS